ncbi:hypothetical protein [Kaistia adipata]|uniref:hypothetical protein n=1 Tax=Kaistia adipata TaxID=166954 RepID=UPI000414BCFE|nr:hypothetical protein [Kaistia adipata]
MLSTQTRFSRPSRTMRETALDKARRLGRLPDLMASEMINLAAGGGSCTEADLRNYGFSATEIAEHAGAANQEAQRRSIRQAAA